MAAGPVPPWGWLTVVGAVCSEGTAVEGVIAPGWPPQAENARATTKNIHKNLICRVIRPPIYIQKKIRNRKNKP